MSKGKVFQVPLQSMPLIDTPFVRVAEDLIGPIFSCNRARKQVLHIALTMVEYSIIYSEAVALNGIEMELVV